MRSVGDTELLRLRRGPASRGLSTTTRRTIVRWVTLLGVLLLAGCAASTIPAVHSEAERLSLARRMMTQKRWASAIELLKSYVQGNAGSADVDEARYLLGLAYLKNREWTMASTEWEQMVREFPESDSTPSASFGIGEALFAQAREPDFDQEYTVKAIDQWNSYLQAYPDHWRHAEAERRMLEARSRLAIKMLNNADLYLKMRFAAPARVYYERVRDEYGDTLLLPRALLGIALCDALEGHREAAILQLKELETRYSGHGVGASAARWRARLERKHQS